MPTESKTIKEYVKRFFEEDVGNPQDCIAKLQTLFGLGAAEAFIYISKYLSEKWGAN